MYDHIHMSAVERSTGTRVSRTGGFRIGVDTGGTFTDIVVGDATGILSVGKALTTRERISRGILEGLAVAAAPLGLDAAKLLRQTAVFIYGSTRATNAILEGKTARTALLVTEGFPDTLVRREGGKTNPWDYSTDYPEPYVPRHLTFEIRERVTAEGTVLVPLHETSTREVLARLRAQRVEAVAVCFLWSIANPAHEIAVGRLLERELPGVPFTLSHEVNPIVREYRRASSASIDASLKPLMQQHLREMEADLRAAGLEGELLPAISLGGVMHIDGVIARPIHMVRSGPSLAPILGQVTGAAEAGATEVIVCDTGGTSFDVSLVRDGRPVFGRDTWLGVRYTGHLTGAASGPVVVRSRESTPAACCASDRRAQVPIPAPPATAAVVAMRRSRMQRWYSATSTPTTSTVAGCGSTPTPHAPRSDGSPLASGRRPRTRQREF